MLYVAFHTEMEPNHGPQTKLAEFGQTHAEVKSDLAARVYVLIVYSSLCGLIPAGTTKSARRVKSL